MGFIDVLIPFAGGVFALLTPIKRKSQDESDEQWAKRRGMVRKAGLLLIGVAGAYLVIRLNQAS